MLNILEECLKNMVIVQRKSRRELSCIKKYLIEKYHLTGKLNVELKKKLVRCCVWSIALYGSESWILSILEWKCFESFQKWILEEN